jgi:hypothetical protein
MVGGKRINFVLYYTKNISRICDQGIYICSLDFRNGSENIGLGGNLPPCTLGGLSKLRFRPQCLKTGSDVSIDSSVWIFY